MGAPGMFSNSDGSFQIDRDIATLERFAELNGDKVVMVDLSPSQLEDIKDARIVMLRAAGRGKYVKGVGIMVHDYRYALYEEE